MDFVLLRAKITNIDNGIVVWEESESGVTRLIEYTVTEISTTATTADGRASEYRGPAICYSKRPL